MPLGPIRKRENGGLLNSAPKTLIGLFPADGHFLQIGSKTPILEQHRKIRGHDKPIEKFWQRLRHILSCIPLRATSRRRGVIEPGFRDECLFSRKFRFVVFRLFQTYLCKPGLFSECSGTERLNTQHQISVSAPDFPGPSILFHKTGSKSGDFSPQLVQRSRRGPHQAFAVVAPMSTFNWPKLSHRKPTASGISAAPICRQPAWETAFHQQHDAELWYVFLSVIDFNQPA